MDQSELTRRDALKVGAVGAAGLGVLTVAGPAAAFPGAQTTATVVVPWLDQPPPVPTPAQGVIPRQLRWEDLDTRLTPNSEHFVVKHYDLPDLSAASWRLSVGGLVARPLVLTLGSLLTQPRREVEFTMECAGEERRHRPAVLHRRHRQRPVGRRAAAPSPARCPPRAEASEVVFWGADRGRVTLGDNPGITGGGRTGTTTPDAGGGLDLTITERFARSMSLEEALAPDDLIAYEMNRAPLPREHGYPARLIAPGWYGWPTSSGSPASS